MIRQYRILVLIIAVTAGVIASSRGMGEDGDPPGADTYLTGKLLVASPTMTDPRFSEAVIFMVDHDAKGAAGLVVNKSLGQGGLAAFLRGFGVDTKNVKGSFDLHVGGPVSPNAIFVLHSSEYVKPGSRAVPGTGVSFTNDTGIMRDIADGKGPKRFLFALGYAGWGPRQLESELARGSWTIAETTVDIIFGNNGDAWKRLSGADGVPL